MDPLYALADPLVSLVNRRIGESTPAREAAERLDGRSLALRVRDTALSVVVTVNEGRLALATLDEIEPDAVIEGSLLALARLGGPGGEALIRSGRVEFSGDAVVADEFRELLRQGRPDWEDELSRVIGGTAAHGVGDVVRSVGRWGRDARETFAQNVGEYLQEESLALPTRYEVEEFGRDVQALRDDVARLEARLELLEANARGGRW